jgi:WD40 repeat protein
MSITNRSANDRAPGGCSTQEPIIRRFEEAWQRGERPVIEEYLSAAGAERRALLPELVHAELECRLKAGEPARVEQYLGRFPELAGNSKAVLDLLAAEYEQRRRIPGMDPEEYARRFPGHAVALQQRLGGAMAGHDPAPPAAESAAAETRPSAPAFGREGGQGTLAPGSSVGPGGPPVVPGYEILGELGRGGMGVVYKARHVVLRRVVALKMILAGGHADAADRARFRGEAEAVARLQHPNIVQIHEVGEVGGLPYFSLEFCSGGSLADRLDGTPLSPGQAAQLIATLARAMQAAHEARVVHRDLKPANVLLAADGTPKVTDFGLAKRLDGVVGHTASGAIMGTPSYMAPEQAAGKSKRVGPAADVYALGAILYELLTGRPPFNATTPLDTLLQVLTEEPVPPRQLEPKLPRDLATICLKCLQKEPGKRYASAEALAEDLRRFLATEPVLARPVGGFERGWRWVKRRLGALAGAGVAGYYRTWLRDANARLLEAVKEAGLQRDQADKARDKAEVARQDKETLLYLVTIERAHSAWRENNVQRADELLEACRPERPPWEWRYLHRLCHSALLTLKGHGSPVTGIAFSPDGTRLASMSGDRLNPNEPGEVKVWNAQTGQETLSLQGPAGAVEDVSWSPDGTRLASASHDRTVKVWDAQTGKEARSLRGHSGAVHGVAWSPDGTRLASASGYEDDQGEFNGEVKVWDPQTGEEALKLQGLTGYVNGVSWSPDGTRLASACEDCRVKCWDTRTGQELLTLQGHASCVKCVAFSPDGSRLASSSEGYDPQKKQTLGELKVWDARTGREVLTLEGHTGPFGNVAWSPDGTRLASAPWYQTRVKIWDAQTGQETLSLQGHTGAVISVAWSPDGRRLASTSHDKTVKVWDAKRGQGALTLQGHTTWVLHVAFSPDGSRLATASHDTTVKVWHVETGQEALTLKGHSNPVEGVSWSPDGARLASASMDGTVKVWDAGTGQEAFTLKAHADGARAAAFSPDGSRLAGTAGHAVIGWDARTGQRVLTLAHMGDVWDVAFSPDGTRLASASGDDAPGQSHGEVKVWDAKTGQEALTLQGHTREVYGVAWSPDGARLASASADRTVRIWDAKTGQQTLSLQGHAESLNSVAFSPDGSRLASASADNTVKVWDAQTGQEVLTLEGHAQQVKGVAWSLDGRYLASASADATVKVWDAGPPPSGPPVAR